MNGGMEASLRHPVSHLWSMSPLLFPAEDAGPLFSLHPVLQSEAGRETLPDNPTLPVPQDLILSVFAKVLISKNNSLGV